MNLSAKKLLCSGTLLLALFALWTGLVQNVDVQTAQNTGTAIGFGTINCWFHQLTGVHMLIYTITDWLGLVPLVICLVFAVMGAVQWMKRKHLMNVDRDILLLGIYYIAVIGGYLVFEIIPINYRPILIDGRLESSYPSSTTLLALSVMPTLVFQINRRVQNPHMKNAVCKLSTVFSLTMVIGRLICGVHWFTDIIGAVLFSMGLFAMYCAAVQIFCDKERSYNGVWRKAS